MRDVAHTSTEIVMSDKILEREDIHTFNDK